MAEPLRASIAEVERDAHADGTAAPDLATAEQLAALVSPLHHAN